MPDVVRTPLRMTCTGINLVSSIDRMPEGAFPYLFNVRVLEEGRLDGRPGYTKAIGLGDSPNSIRRLNDPTNNYASKGYIYVGGGGPNLYAGVESSYSVVDTGYSGDPLSLIPFRPDGSPESWMYVYDQKRMMKLAPDLTLREIGIVPPSRAPSIEYGIPAMAVITDGFTAAGWTGTNGTVGATGDRTGGAAPTI